MTEPAATSSSTAFLALGSNQGDRHAHLQAAVARLNGTQAVDVIEGSPVYESEPHTRDPDERQPPYLNAVLRVATTRSPQTLLRIAHEIEQAEGRCRTDQRWAPRSLDIDLLAYDDEVRQEERLTLPHPRLAERRFVLRPWADLAPNFVVPPPFEKSVQSLLAQCPDSAALRQTEKDLDVSAVAPPGT